MASPKTDGEKAKPPLHEEIVVASNNTIAEDTSDTKTKRYFHGRFFLENKDELYSRYSREEFEPPLPGEAPPIQNTHNPRENVTHLDSNHGNGLQGSISLNTTDFLNQGPVDIWVAQTQTTVSSEIATSTRTSTVSVGKNQSTPLPSTTSSTKSSQTTTPHATLNATKPNDLSSTNNLSTTTISISLKYGTTTSGIPLEEIRASGEKNRTLGAKAGDEGDSTIYILPAALAIILVVGTILAAMILRKRFVRKRRRTKFNQNESEPEAETKVPVYAVVDKSKKKNRSAENGQVLEMHELIPDGNNDMLRADSSAAIYQGTESIPSAYAPTIEHLLGAVDNEEDEDAKDLVENDIYESSNVLNRGENEGSVSSSSENEEDELDRPIFVQSSRGYRCSGIRANKALPPLPKCIGAHPADSDCPACGSEANSSIGDSDTESTHDPTHYLSPTCHDHPSQGPNWLPFHPYDPVYVPSSSAGDMERRVDSTGYVSRPGVRKDTGVYEEINYSAIKTPPDVRPKMTMGATASGGQKPPPPPRMLPVIPRDSNNSRGAYGFAAIACYAVSNEFAPNRPHSNGYVPRIIRNQNTHNVLNQDSDQNTQHEDIMRLSRPVYRDSSRTSSTVSSNKEDMYETVEFPDPQL